MLTRDDVTLADARAVYAEIADSGVTHVGCKDVGLPRDELKLFMDEIRANGHTSYLEVVAETDEATLASAQVAAEVKPDYCIGGTLIPEIQEILAGTGVKFMPYVGQIVGHPCLLRGSIDEIVADTKAAAARGRRRHQPARLPLRRRCRRAGRGRRRRHRPARDLRRLGRLGRAHPRAREPRGVGLHDRHGGARRRARAGCPARRAARARADRLTNDRTRAGARAPRPSDASSLRGRCPRR